MGIDSLVRCEVCKRELRVSFSACLAGGWPKCHGATMSLIEKPKDMGAATREAMESQIRPLKIVRG
jgi:hypothetical protein